MGWERRGGRSYYYRKERTADGRVRSVYVGSGRVAELGARLDALRCEEAERERHQLRRSLAPIDADLGALRTAEAELRALRDAYLVATGHRTHRGQWRRRRGFSAPPFVLPTDRPGGADPMARKKKPASAPASSPDVQHAAVETALGYGFIALPETAGQEGCNAVAAALAKVDTDNPTGADVSALRDALARLPAGDLAPLAARAGRRTVAESMNGGRVGYAVAHFEAEAERFARSLAGDDGPLVRAAAEQAATARLVLDSVTRRYGTAFQGTYGLAEMDHLERRMNSAQTRYLRALATVAALRKAEGTERERAAKMEREAPAAPARRPLDLADFLPPALPTSASTPRQLPPHAGDSTPAPADVELVAG